MGLWSWMTGGKDEKPQRSGPMPSSGLAARRDVCPTCSRQLLPSSRCPFCNPQQVADPLLSTTEKSQNTDRGIANLGGVVVTAQAARQHGAKGFLYVYQGKNQGVSVLLTDKTVSIGRNPDQNTMVLNDDGVSTKHCEVRSTPFGFQMVDVGSKNGTFVNDMRLKERDLSEGDVISFGGTRIYVGIV